MTATVRDRLRGDTYEIRAKYLIGADGGRSKVAEDAGLPMGGQMGVAGSINIVFDADLSKYTAHRPSTLYWVLAPGATVGGIGAGLVRNVRPWNEWMIVWGYDVTAGAPDLTTEYAESVVRQPRRRRRDPGDHQVVLGVDGQRDVRRDVLRTAASSARATPRTATRRPTASAPTPPSRTRTTWPGSSSWSSTAPPAPKLLDTYTAERAPVGKQIVTRANKSIGETAPIFEALDGLSPQTPEQLWANIAARKDATEAAAKQRQALREAIAFKVYEFNAHGVDLNQRYASDAIVPDGTEDPGFDRDPELHHQPSSRPGAKLPHAWITSGPRTLSTLDAVGRGRFTLFTGIGGDELGARGRAPRRSDRVATVVIGPGQEYEDPYGDWARLSEISDAGALLVRPDGLRRLPALRAASEDAEELLVGGAATDPRTRLSRSQRLPLHFHER